MVYIKGRLFTRAFCKNSWSEWKLASDFSGNYNDLINKPTPYTLPHSKRYDTWWY